MAQNATSSINPSYELIKFEDLDSGVQTLVRKAVAAREFSYSPYSNFKVGACVELEGGELVTGCNVENASFTVGTCAERCALFKAISDGKIAFVRIAIVAFQPHEFVSPCGACRQFMNEFGEFDVYLAKPQLGTVLKTTVRRLLPLGFQLSDSEIKACGV